MIIGPDTSALFAAFDADQSEHERAAALMETEMLIVSPLVLTELDHLIHRPRIHCRHASHRCTAGTNDRRPIPTR